MNWFKVLGKGIAGLITGIAATAAANPEAITTLAGQKNAITVGAIVSLITALSNWYKNRERI